jgi:serine protein kinase
MNGLSTRFAFKILSKVFNFDQARSPPTRCTCCTCWSSRSSRSSSRKDVHERYLRYLKEVPGAALRRVHRQGDPDRLSGVLFEYGQNIFDRYVLYADFWIQDQEYRDPDTGEIFDRAGAERGAGEDRETGRHQQPEGFPQRGGQLRAACPRQQQRQEPILDVSYEKLRVVIEKKMFSNTEDLLPVISFNPRRRRRSSRSTDFVTRMTERGYTEKAGATAGRVVSAGSQVAVNRRRLR